MDNNFLEWKTFLDYTFMTGFVMTIVQVTKNVPYVNRIPTQYWSIVVAVIIRILSVCGNGLFSFANIPLYVFDGILVSLAANGAHNIGENVTRETFNDNSSKEN